MRIESVFNRLPGIKISRKAFVRLCGIGLGGMILNSYLFKLALGKEDVSSGRPHRSVKTLHDLVVAKGEDPYLMTVKAIEAIGGMERFVKKGGIVVIKPNIGWDRSPEQAANTNPYVVGALVDMCFKSGAKRVNVFDITCNDAKLCYQNSGIEKIARDKGANVYFTDDWNFIKAGFDYESPMQGWPIYRDALECDTFINVPILKSHGLTGLTLSMKNLMGVCGGSRGLMHFDIATKLAHLTDFIKPDLTVIDAYRALVRYGPTGGNLADVVDMKTLIAGTDPVLCDSYAAKLMDRDPLSIGYISQAVKINLGNADISKADILTLTA
ncbi:MAG: DUF362 domain-containing protein [Candidatus Omnitrophota bacterium]|nr:DUF362 domain-containing protein [Candidatus Omnitrophota bacterium]